MLRKALAIAGVVVAMVAGSAEQAAAAAPVSTIGSAAQRTCLDAATANPGGDMAGHVHCRYIAVLRVSPDCGCARRDLSDHQPVLRVVPGPVSVRDPAGIMHRISTTGCQQYRMDVDPAGQQR